MKNGAFSFLDCLGFKGIWARDPQANPQEILGFLIEAKKHADSSPIINAVQMSAPHVEQSIVFVSDTIAISTRFKSEPSGDFEAANGYLISLNVILAAELCKRFAGCRPPLMFRGCVTFGEHIAEDSFLLGQAVDEAASVAESTEGAFIWLTPKAQALLRGYDQYRLTTSSAMLRKQHPNDAIAAVNAIIEMQERFESQSVYPDETRKNRIWWRKLNEQQQQKVAAEILW